MKKILALTLALCMVFTLCACGQNEAPATDAAPAAQENPTENATPTYSFKFAVTAAPTDPQSKFAQQMIDEIVEKTNGDVAIELHTSGELGSINDVNEMIAQGAAMINYTGADAFNAIVPDLGILNCQFCLSNPDQMTKVMTSDWYKEQIETLAAEGDTRLLTNNWFTGYRHFATKFPVSSADDFKGKNMRVADAAALIAFAKAIGCAPVVTAWNETYTGLSNGMLDCAECPLNSLWASSIQEVTDNIVLTGHLVSCGGICMNEDIFKSMPEEYQEIFINAAYAAGEAYKEDSLKSQEECLKLFEDAGKTIITLSDEEQAAFKANAATMYKDPSLGFTDGLYDMIQEIIAD